MSTYRYISIRAGVEERGVMDAPSRFHVTRQLKARGYSGIHVQRAGTGDAGFISRIFGTSRLRKGV